MPTDQRARLSRIRRFDQLVAYLRDELGWPIASDDFEELTFEYTPGELGIDPKNAAKIQEIRRLRPLATGQPWGIFFVKFEPKRLPVVALRRILGRVTLKKRASANWSERQAWAADDLLFVSNFGEGEERRIAFAHFSTPLAGNDLPTLKVLGWDNLDTPLHLDAVAHELTTHLAWPDDEEDIDSWREHWRSAFGLRHREVVTTSKQLSGHLAELARAIRDRTLAALAIENESGALTKLLNAFQTTLVHDLDEAKFADMYAQTIAYGLLSARITDPTRRRADDLAIHMRTNPFLRKLMEAFLRVGGRGGAGGPDIDFDELGVSEVVDLLDRSNMEAVVRDFGDSNPEEDPVIHFYEHFLAAYDKQQKVSRGVFYTPRPVVSYIVRSVHETLQSEFGLPDGLADTATWEEISERHDGVEKPKGVSPEQAFVQILDPATGTGTFLVEVIDLIHDTMSAKWRSQGQGERAIRARWNEYVPKHLLPRLHGYELLMAPYAIAHLKIGLKLYETGYRFESDERARVYLTNALEPPRGDEQFTLDLLPALAQEAAAVNEIKRSQRFTVVIGNPPYKSVSLNRGPWIQELVDDYRQLPKAPMKERGNRNQLQDDYVKFYRLAHLLTCQAGVVGLITNSSYLRGPWFRAMRYQLQRSFRNISILDLHGAQSHSLDSHESDQNVFEITTSVAIALLWTAASSAAAPDGVRYAEIVGPRQTKYGFLSSHSTLSVRSQPLAPHPDNQWRFLPHDSTGQEEWSHWPPVPELFNSWGAGVLTNRNGLAVDADRRALMRKIGHFADLSIPDQTVEERYKFSSNYQWNTGRARRDFASQELRDLAEPYTFRPFDVRWVYWHRRIVYNMRGDKMEAFRRRHPSVGLMFSRNTKHNYYSNVYVTRHIADRHCLEEANVAPLYIPVDEGVVAATALSNLSGRASDAVAKMGLRLTHEAHGDLATCCGAQDLLSYVYAVLYSNNYRERYADFLKIDFPRTPLAGSVDLFSRLVAMGRKLIAIHLLESSRLDHPVTNYTGPRNPEVSRVGGSLAAKITAGDHVSLTGTARSATPAVWLDLAGPCPKKRENRCGLAGSLARPRRLFLHLRSGFALGALPAHELHPRRPRIDSLGNAQDLTRRATPPARPRPSTYTTVRL